MSCAAPAQFFSLGAPSGPRRVLKACRRSFQNQLFQTPLHSWGISESFSWVLQARLSRWKREPINPSQHAGKQPPSQVALRQQLCAGGARNRGCYCLPRQREGITPGNSCAAGGPGSGGRSGRGPTPAPSRGVRSMASSFCKAPTRVQGLPPWRQSRPRIRP